MVRMIIKKKKGEEEKGKKKKKGIAWMEEDCAIEETMTEKRMRIRWKRERGGEGEEKELLGIKTNSLIVWIIVRSNGGSIGNKEKI